MNRRRSHLTNASRALFLAIAWALLSSFVQREGPELESYGNLCGSARDENCYQPVLKGGFPFAYLFDSPGVSVERQLFFGEDRLEPAALVLDVAVYWAVLMLASRFASRKNVAADHGPGRGDA